MAAKKEVGTATYILTMRDGAQKKVTVPANWKVTFGALVPGSKNHEQNSGGATALRFYEGASQQRACFVGVTEFRDKSIDIMEKIVDVQSEQIAKRDSEGNVKHYNVQATESKWIDPDAEVSPQPIKRAKSDLISLLGEK